MDHLDSSKTIDSEIQKIETEAISERIALPYFAAVLWKNRWSIVLMEIVALLITLIWSFSMPVVYTASSIIRPAPGIIDFLSSNLLMTKAIISSEPLVTNLEMPQLSTTLLVARLKSSRMLDDLIQQLHLTHYYQVNHYIKARWILKDRLKVSDINGELVRISVQDRDPDKAAHIVSVIIGNVDAYNRNLYAEGARDRSRRLKRLLDQAGQMFAVESNGHSESRSTSSNITHSPEPRKRNNELDHQKVQMRKNFYDSLLFLHGQSTLIEKYANDKEWSTIEIIEKASPPREKSWPRISTNLIIAGIIAFLFGALIIVIRDTWKNENRSPV